MSLPQILIYGLKWLKCHFFSYVYFVIFATTLFLIGTTFGGMLEQVDGFNCDLTAAVGLSLASVYITIQLNVYFLCHLLYSEASCL